MSPDDRAISVLVEWYDRLDRYQDRLPAKGSIAAALHVLNRLCDDYQLTLDAHVAKGGMQITGLSAKSVAEILQRFSETRTLTAVAGRSNRGGPGDVRKLLEAMKPIGLDQLSAKRRIAVLQAMQEHMVKRFIPPYFAARKVKAAFDPSAATARFVRFILDEARDAGKAGAVAEHLVGAKLALLYPGKSIRNKSFSTSDAQGGHEGDFTVGNTVFHVTVTPMPELYEKLKSNLERGFRVYLLVPSDHSEGARQNAATVAEGRIAVEPIESFVATNIDEAAEFDGSKLKSGCRRLLEIYNQRVDAVEIDKSLLIEIPPNL